MIRQPVLLLAGNFLSARGLGRSPIEDLAEKLAQDWRPICVSGLRNGWLRAGHLLLTALIYRSRYDLCVVDLYSGKAFLWGETLSVLLKVLRCPFILALHGGALPEFSRRWPRRVRACLRRATFVTVPSRYLLTEMSPYRQDLHLLPNALNISEYPFRVRATPAPRLIWLRRFRYVYNPELAPKVLSLLVQEFPDMRLTMIGPDWGDGSLIRTRAVADQLGVSERIAFVGGIARTEVPKFLNQGDIFLNTTNFDNNPVSVLEAMACGLCVVTTGVGGIPYLLDNGRDGLVVPRDDPEAAAEAIRRIITVPGLGAKLSVSARSKAEQLDWAAVLPQWNTLLSQAAERSA